MNSLQSRIHDDAANAAAQITPADVPPLRLPQPQRGRRWLVPLAAAVSVVAVIAAVVAVGRADSGGHTRPAPAATGHPSHKHATPASQRAQAMLATEALDSFFAATGAQYTDGLAYNWTQLKISARIYGSCMAQAGYPQPPFTEPEGSYLLSFPDNSQFPDLAQRAATDSMTGLNYIAQTQTRPRSAAGRADASRCKTASDKPFAAISQIATALATRWTYDVTAIETSATVRAKQSSFAACLEGHGVPAAYARQQNDASNPLFTGFFAWADHLSQAASTTKQQTSDDHRWTPVFVTCAKGTVSVTERLQLAKQASFFKQHAHQVQEIRARAEALASTSH